MTLVRLDFACNDPDNGLFDGQCAGIQLPDLDLELSSNNMRGSSFRVFVGSIKISRRVFPFERSKDWYGNWCWNAYWFELEVAVDLLTYVHSTGAFSADQGEERLFHIWNMRLGFDRCDREFLSHRLQKGMLAEQAERMA